MTHVRRLASAPFDERWFLAIRAKKWRTLDERDEDGFRLISPPPEHSYADPFLLKRDGTHYVFFEDIDHRIARGSIACAPVDAFGLTVKPEIVLSRDFHFSYPFVFESDGQVYLLPETSGNRNLELYGAVDFPLRWERAAVLMTDVHVADATLIQHGSRYWLFAAVESARQRHDWEALHLFSSDSLFGPWRPHRMNPVVLRLSGARPAGRPFSDRGQLIRPGQDCTRRYGQGVVLNRVDVLNDEDYREQEIGRISSSWIPGNRGTHHLDHDDELEVIDGRFLSRRVPRALIQMLARQLKTVR
jgi:hypothetical protein